MALTPQGRRACLGDPTVRVSAKLLSLGVAAWLGSGHPGQHPGEGDRGCWSH